MNGIYMEYLSTLKMKKAIIKKLAITANAALMKRKMKLRNYMPNGYLLKKLLKNQDEVLMVSESN